MAGAARLLDGGCGGADQPGVERDPLAPGGLLDAGLELFRQPEVDPDGVAVLGLRRRRCCRCDITVTSLGRMPRPLWLGGGRGVARCSWVGIYSQRDRATPRTSPADEDLFDGYLDPKRPHAGAYDEMFAPDFTVRAAYRRLHES